MHSHMKRVEQEIITMGGVSKSSQDYRAMLMDVLRKAVPFDAACCTAVDPQTLLSTGAVTEEGVETIHYQLFENEYMHEDFNKYAYLAKANKSAATLSGATDGRMERSARYRNILEPAGFKDEMRVALVCEGSCWGYLTLFRHQPLFNDRECSFVSSLVPSIARVLRTKSLAFPIEETNDMQMEPGILVLSDRLVPISTNTAADHWISLLQTWERIDSQLLPRPIRAVCFRAKAEKPSDPERTPQAKVCIRTPDGQFLTIRASRLSGMSTINQLAVWFETARPTDILPLMAESYGLSLREKHILEKVLRGFSTKEIALALNISSYTVQDHLKSIFAKTAVTSRRELIWHVFARFSLPYTDHSLFGMHCD